MINLYSLSHLDRAQFTPQFKKPLYDSYAYSLIPSTIAQLLTDTPLGGTTLAKEAVGGSWKKQDIVILFLIDGFGWHFFEKHVDAYDFLKRYTRGGVVSKISSQFPSTTAAHISTICTGLEVGQTGIYEWFQYEPLVDDLIAPLLFSRAGDHQPATLIKKGVDPLKLFAFRTFYQILQERAVTSYVIQPNGIIHSPYTQALFQGAHGIGYQHFSEGLIEAARLCNTLHQQPLYIFAYYGDIDAAAHRHGIDSQESQEAIKTCFNALEQFFWHALKPTGKRIAVILTADHGMTSVDPKTTLYLNKQFPQLTNSIKRNQQGQCLAPAGSCRDFFLHIEEDKLQEVYAFLSAQLREKAEVFFVKDLVQKGFFGHMPPSQRFLERVGNLVILPYRNESIWWFEKHRFEQHFYAVHGGLSAEEMESLLLYAEVS